MPRSDSARAPSPLHRSLGRSLCLTARSRSRPWVRADLGYRGIGGMNLTRAPHLQHLPADSRRARFIFFCQRQTRQRSLAGHRRAPMRPKFKDFSLWGLGVEWLNLVCIYRLGIDKWAKNLL